MQFIETTLKGAYVIEIEKVEDERGFFARAWCKNEFAAMGLSGDFVQCNISFNKKKGTIRGMHYQAMPYKEDKVVRCTRGAIYDVIIDIREESPTFKQWFAMELSSENYKMLYIPQGFAHGFQTLDDNSEVFYQMSEFYKPEFARGIHWNDPAIGIAWPLEPQNISVRDNNYRFLGDNP